MEKSRLISNIDEFFTMAYKYSLTRNNNQYEHVVSMERDGFMQKDSIKDIFELIKTYYIPHVKPNIPNFIKQSDFIALWKELPSNLMIKNLNLIYQAETQGYSLSNIFKLEQKYTQETIIMFFIQDNKDNIFGGIVSNLFKKTKKFIRPLFIYLFSIKPELGFYDNSDTDDNLYCDDDSLIIGTGLEGAALSLDSNLKHGNSFEYNSFNSCIFGGGHFEVSRFEIYQMTS